jgi:hypothetical protein
VTVKLGRFSITRPCDSKQLVEATGGTIGVISEPGRGSTFWFEVPLSVT